MSLANAAYFAAGTPGTAHFVALDDWEASLFHGLLFQPELRIIDGGIVAGPHLWNHLYNTQRRGETSWLEEALRTEVLRPHLRSATLGEIVRELRANRFANVGKESEQVAERLDRVGFQPLHWPTDISIGDRYKRIVTSKFSSEVPDGIEMLSRSEVGEALVEFWVNPDVKRWRTDWIARAIERTAAHSEQGLRYSDIVCVAYETLTGKPSFPGLTVQDILDSAPSAQRTLSAHLRIYFKMLCEFHGYNFAEAIGCRPSLVNVDALTAAVVLTPRSGSRPSEDIEELGMVRLPTLKEFRRTGGQTLTLLRSTDEAQAYFSCLDVWLHAPSEESRASLAMCLANYSNKICELLELGSPRLSPILSDSAWSLFVGGGASACLAMAFDASVPHAWAASAVGTLVSALAAGTRSLVAGGPTSSVCVVADRSALPVCRDLTLQPQAERALESPMDEI